MLTPENLKPLLSEKTALVTCTHTSNVLGTIHDVKKIAEMVHTIPGAKLCVDGVALAPHREVDVKALGVDFYAFSWYKVSRCFQCDSPQCIISSHFCVDNISRSTVPT